MFHAKRKMLEDRRIISRLTLLYKSVHIIVAINCDKYYANHEKGKITSRKSTSISFSHPTARKNCQRYFFIPRTVAEWNRLPATMGKDPHLKPDCFIKLSTNFARSRIA